MSLERAIYAIGTLRSSEGAMQESWWSNLPGRIDGPADAYRHILLAAELTRRFGEDYARAILELHERTGAADGQTSAAEAMDRANNEVGIDIGRNATSWEDVVSRARNEFSDYGRATWLPPSEWRVNPTDANGNRIPTGDSRLNWPPSWPTDGAPYPEVDYDPIDPVDLPGTWEAEGWPMPDEINQWFGAAANYVEPKDPLVLDLDGNGISTLAINPSDPLLFDQDGDGIKTATGWVASGEAIVVRDLNGNGTIDSGRELFGDSTVLTRGPNAGQTAANGFEALADLDLDANGVSDGKFDSSDLAYSSVQLWKDLNQDGLSQADELFTFEQLGPVNTTC